MKRKYIIKRFILGICVILVIGAMLWLNYLVLIDRIPAVILWTDIPAILLLAKMSDDMDHATAMIEFSEILNEVFGDDTFDEEDLDI